MAKNKNLQPLVRSNFNLLALGLFAAVFILSVLYIFKPQTYLNNTANSNQNEVFKTEVEQSVLEPEESSASNSSKVEETEELEHKSTY